jgi:hypothetical protein
MGRMNYADVKKENEKFYIHSIIPPAADEFMYSKLMRVRRWNPPP